MSFKPIYWYYGNTKFSSEEIYELKSNIDKIDAEKLTENNVASTAISIPSMPKIFPLRELSGEDKPLKAMIKNIPDIT